MLAEISDGEATTLVNPAPVIALLLLASGALALRLGNGRFVLPRCETDASRLALLGGGATAVALGALMTVQVILGVAG